jgi:hypothetical protein
MHGLAMSDQTVIEVLSFWLPVIIIGVLILGAFPF